MDAADATDTATLYPPLRASPIAELIRKGAEDVARRQGDTRATSKVNRMINSLQWRQMHSSAERYPLPLDTGKVLHIRQLQAGEVTGLGTGATVWPAAHVLVKYLERRYGPMGMAGLRVVDLGSGTGVAGIAAAMLGAEVMLTDQEQLVFLMRENADEACVERHEACGSSSESLCGGAADAAGMGAKATGVHVLTYDWGGDDAHLSPPVDVILVSDCVLPKLYPIEPLLAAIDCLSGPGTVSLLSYEHRHYEHFDPRTRFQELAAARGLVKTDVPQSDHHPVFSADDIEIWEVRRGADNGRPPMPVPPPASGSSGLPPPPCSEPGPAPQRESLAAAANPGPTAPAAVAAGGGADRDVVVIDKGGVGNAGGGMAAVAAAAAATEVWIMGEQHTLAQDRSGAIGRYLWPSGTVMARHLVATADAFAARARVLELGAGVGLVAMTAALLGWEVVATDKVDVVPLLRANAEACLSSTRRTPVGTVRVLAHDWGSDAKDLLGHVSASGARADTGGARGTGDDAGAVGGLEGEEDETTGHCDLEGEGDETLGHYDLVVCADCLYATASVAPLLATLSQVAATPATAVLLSNEPRSALEEFLRRARQDFAVEQVHLSEADLAAADPSARHQGRLAPTPVVLHRLRRQQWPAGGA